MSATFERLKTLVAAGEVRISEHDYDELFADGLFAKDIVTGMSTAELVEEYPDFPRVRVSWCLDVTATANPCMLCEACRRANRVRRCWSRRTARTLSVGRKILKADKMTTKCHTKLVHEGLYVAEVDVKLVHSADGWSPHLTLEDATKLDDVREALRREDLAAAGNLARIFTLTPVGK